ncbi:hypothetical protein AA93_12395 (plasmid) [Xylella fastidiosa subsp. pauca 11399]|nr:hypothetical protein AA93_12395 [Xylella fastidiosa subsp. pauca 11399]
MRTFLKNAFTTKNAGIAVVLLVGSSKQTQAGIPVTKYVLQQVSAVEQFKICKMRRQTIWKRLKILRK